MATFKTNLYNAQDADRANPARLPAANQASGAVHVAVVPYTTINTSNPATPVAEQDGDTINLCVLPAGAIPIPGLSFVDLQVPGTTLTVNIGYESNSAALAQALDLSDGGHVSFTSGTMPTDALVPKAIGAGDTVIVATLASVDGLLEGKKMVFHVAYKVPA
jgi:hypothetical protein